MANDCCARPPARDHVAACPACAHRGVAVGTWTVRALTHAPAPTRDVPDGEWWLCETPDCPVVYFDAHSGITRWTSDVLCRVATKVPVGPRPVCYCFSFTDAEVISDVVEHGRSTIKDYIRGQVRAGACECEIRNPSGRCCLPAVQRALKRAGGPGSSDRPRAPSMPE